MTQPDRSKPFEPFDASAPSGTWSPSAGQMVRGGPDWARMIEALRLVQDRITGASLPLAQVPELAEQLEGIAAKLAPHQVPEAEQITGHRIDLPGRGQTMAPPFIPDEWDAQHAKGRVVFSRFYLGGGGAAHGGAIPLLFDEILGRLANSGGRIRSRTAYLNVDYRNITPIEVELTAEGRFEREEGRKRFLYGVIRDGDTVLAEAHGLFVQLRPEQP
ncbi:MAG: PaaI family thioesterase [Mycobacterium sp.]|nr:PaaI family thioesterase [Mycobacterium sp.]